MSTPFVVAGGIVRNRAWILPRHLQAVAAAGPREMFYITGDNKDATESVLYLWTLLPINRDGGGLEYALRDTGSPGYKRDPGPFRYSSENMAMLRNLWASAAVERWPQLTHLWVVDSDVLPESDCLMRLLAVNRPVVGAWVPGCTPMSGWAKSSDDPKGFARRIGSEAKHETPFHATMLGGCYLVRRDAWDAGLRWATHVQGEDGGFSDSARALGIELWAEPRALCEHIMEEPK